MGLLHHRFTPWAWFPRAGCGRTSQRRTTPPTPCCSAIAPTDNGSEVGGNWIRQHRLPSSLNWWIKNIVAASTASPPHLCTSNSDLPDSALTARRRWLWVVPKETARATPRPRARRRHPEDRLYRRSGPSKDDTARGSAVGHRWPPEEASRLLPPRGRIVCGLGARTRSPLASLGCGPPDLRLIFAMVKFRLKVTP